MKIYILSFLETYEILNTVYGSLYDRLCMINNKALYENNFIRIRLLESGYYCTSTSLCSANRYTTRQVSEIIKQNNTDNAESSPTSEDLILRIPDLSSGLADLQASPLLR